VSALTICAITFAYHSSRHTRLKDGEERNSKFYTFAMPHLISPQFTDAKLASGCTLEDKIDVFEDWMTGWLLRHAHALCDDAYVFRKDAGFAVLMIATAYFEPIESYYTGRSSDHNSKQFFRCGFLRVFSGLTATLTQRGYVDAEGVAKKLVDEIYDHMRCGLFHEGGAKYKLLIREDTAPLNAMLQTNTGDVGSIVIDPRRFLAEIQHHLSGYVAQLRDASETDLRKNFELFFDRRISSEHQTVAPPPVSGA